METVKNRRSIRKYAGKPVDEELLRRLLEVSERTQTMGNMQLYSVVVTRSEEMKKRLAPAHFNQPMVTQAPVILTICADFNRTVKWAEQRKAQPEGLGICYLGTTLYMPSQIIDILQLPRLVMPVATLTVGWPDEHPEQTDRLPLEAVVHEETYHDYIPETIDRYYGPKEQLPENRHFVEINHKETLAQIFTDIRYTRKDNEAMSRGMLEALKRQGFLD